MVKKGSFSCFFWARDGETGCFFWPNLYFQKRVITFCYLMIMSQVSTCDDLRNKQKMTIWPIKSIL